MKKLSNIASFALFGIIVELVLLAVVNAEISVYAMALVASFFVFYRILIDFDSTETYAVKEFRRFWIRNAPENTLTFALIGAGALVLANFYLWSFVSLSQLAVAGFFSVGFTRIVFEIFRVTFNEIKKNWVKKKLEVKKTHDVQSTKFIKSGKSIANRDFCRS